MILAWTDIFRTPARTGLLWVAIVAITTLLVLRASVTIFVQVIRHGGRAIWIENGVLRYPDSSRMTFASVPLGDVQDVSIVPGAFLRPKQVAIHAQGGIDYIRAYFFHPSAETIRARLAEALSLRVTS